MPNGHQHTIAIQATKVRALEVITLINDFLTFCDREVIPASKELSKMGERSRVRLQKLVYSHLIDKFDQLTDRILLWSATHLSEARREILEKMSSTTPLTIGRIYELFLLGDKAVDSIEEEMLESSREVFSRSNHADKVRKITKYIGWSDAEKQQRINTKGKIASGSIKARSLQKGVPSSVIGFAHYLFARRSGISHGDGTKFTDRDRAAINNAYHVNLPLTFRIKPTSIDTAVTFYSEVLNHFINEVGRIR
jgi:hypothetical protein